MTKSVFDYSKLRGLLRENSMTLADYAGIIGISNTSLYERLANKKAITQAETDVTKRNFNLSADQVDLIFFTAITENRI